VTGHPRKVVATRTRVRSVTFTPPPKRSFSDGTYLVPEDIRPGLYQTDGHGDGTGCYWETDRNLSGDFNAIVSNDNIDGPTTIQLGSNVRAFKVNGGCLWHERV
jgi:hypothetical protein